jgi:hypothetical protein
MNPEQDESVACQPVIADIYEPTQFEVYTFLYDKALSKISFNG